MVAGGAAAPASAQTPMRVGIAPRIPARAQALGALGASTAMQVLVALNPSDSVALADYATAVSTPGSGVYRNYLSLTDFRRLFAPSSAQVAAVEASLRAQGLDPGPVSANGLLIPVDGSAGAIAHGFGTGLERYRLATGRVAYANTGAPQLNTSVAGLVAGVIGLSDLSVPHALGLSHARARGAAQLRPQIVTGGPQPCSGASFWAAYWGAYTADELASAYNFSSLYGSGDEGAGQTVALLELEPNFETDVADYQSCYGTDATVNDVEIDGGAGTGAGEGEAALDIEDVIGLAPKATVDVYQAPNSDAGLLDAYSAIASNPAVDVVSTSWGLCEPDADPTVMSEENTLFEEAATAGESVFAAAGDDGSTDCRTAPTSRVAVDDPASQPFVTGVGGLTLSNTSYPPSETVWNDSGLDNGAGGGGISSVHSMPSYQSGAPSALSVISAHSSGIPCAAGAGHYCREVPDVSADGDPDTGYLIIWDGDYAAFGGTSAAAPLWAAFTVLVDASSACGGLPIGFANPDLYDAAASAYASDFTDVTSGNNDYTPSGYSGGLYSAGTGYDMASGLGSPDGATLPATLCGNPGPNTVSLTSPGAQSSAVGSHVSLQLSGSDSAGAGTALTFIAAGLPPGLSVSSSGLITGTPTAAGTYTVTIGASDAAGSRATTHPQFSWTVSNAVAATSPGNQTTIVGIPVSLQLSGTDSGGDALRFAASGLPAGLSISSSGVITGTPTTVGVGAVTVTATDTTGASGQATFSWTVNARPPNIVSVASPGNQTTTAGTAVSLQLTGGDSGGATLSFSGSGLPAGLSISSSGLVTGTPTNPGTTTVTISATDSTGGSGSATFSWTVDAACTRSQLLRNPSFESGPSGWSVAGRAIVSNRQAGGAEVAYSGSSFAWLGGRRAAHGILSQTITIPAGCKTATLRFWRHIDTTERAKRAVDKLTVQLIGHGGAVLATLATYSNLGAARGYHEAAFNLVGFAGQTVTLRFRASDANRTGHETNFCIDDTALES